MDVLLFANLFLFTFCFVLAFRTYDNLNKKMNEFEKKTQRMFKNHLNNLNFEDTTPRRRHLTLISKDDNGIEPHKD